MSSQADFLYSSVLLPLPFCTPPTYCCRLLLYSSSLLTVLLPLTTYCGRFLLQLRNSARSCRRGMDTHDRKHMSRDRYQRLYDVTALRNNCPISGYKENTSPVLLAACVFRALPSNEFTIHNIIVRKYTGLEFAMNLVFHKFQVWHL
jgi:hypothetical protein